MVVDGGLGYGSGGSGGYSVCTIAFTASTAYPIVIGAAGSSKSSGGASCTAVPTAVGEGGAGCRGPSATAGSGGGSTQVSSPTNVIAIAGGCAFINFFVFLILSIKSIKNKNCKNNFDSNIFSLFLIMIKRQSGGGGGGTSSTSTSGNGKS